MPPSFSSAPTQMLKFDRTSSKQSAILTKVISQGNVGPPLSEVNIPEFKVLFLEDYVNLKEENHNIEYHENKIYVSNLTLHYRINIYAH